jgi:hypothetical protein
MVANNDDDAKDDDGPAGFNTSAVTRFHFKELVKPLCGHFISTPHELENKDITYQSKNEM